MSVCGPTASTATTIRCRPTSSKRFSQGLTFTVAYAYSKSLDVGNDQPGFTDNLDLKRQYGPSGFDRTHMITASHLYELPFGKGKPFLNQSRAAGLILGGWQLNGIFRFATGTPSPPRPTPPHATARQRQFADAIAPVTYLGGIGPGTALVQYVVVRAAGAEPLWHRGRNTIRGPGSATTIFRSSACFPITERFRLEYRAEFYNLTNTPHFANPSGTCHSATFGIISSTLSGYGNRQVQMALRLKF